MTTKAKRNDIVHTKEHIATFGAFEILHTHTLVPENSDFKDDQGNVIPTKQYESVQIGTMANLYNEAVGMYQKMVYTKMPLDVWNKIVTEAPVLTSKIQ